MNLATKKTDKGAPEIGEVLFAIQQFKNSDCAAYGDAIPHRQAPRPEIVNKRNFGAKFLRQKNRAELAKTKAIFRLCAGQHVGVAKRLDLNPIRFRYLSGAGQTCSGNRYFLVDFVGNTNRGVEFPK